MSRFYTSDTHFGHERIVTLSNRPFKDVTHMNEEMIRRWNSVVTESDIVYHLGDVAMGKIDQSLPLVSRLNGIKVLIPGNHDRIFSGESERKRDRFLPEYKKVFHYILPEQVNWHIPGGPEEDYPVVLSHFPYVGDSHDIDRHADKRPVDNGKALIHGHVHEKWKTNGRQFNVGVDVSDFTPVHESVIIEWLERL